MSQRDWDERYLLLAAHISTWSKDPKRKVGAVLVRDNRIISTGYNGLPEGVGDTFHRLTQKSTKLAMVVHAEENALLSAGERARGATLYVYGLPVCARCASSIIQARISRIIAQPPACKDLSHTKMELALKKPPDNIDWDAMGELAVKMFQESKISFVGMNLRADQTTFLSKVRTNIRRSGKDRRANATAPMAPNKSAYFG